jgi:hypothetical protein
MTGTVGVVSEILFEHSPGRGDPAFTGDGTAFDVLVRAKTPTGRSAFLAVEVKYTEAPGGTSIAPNGRYDELSREAAVFRDPDAPALRGGALFQLWRQHLLATAMLRRGLYEEGPRRHRGPVAEPAALRCGRALRLAPDFA